MGEPGVRRRITASFHNEIGEPGIVAAYKSRSDDGP